MEILVSTVSPGPSMALACTWPDKRLLSERGEREAGEEEDG